MPVRRQKLTVRITLPRVNNNMHGYDLYAKYPTNKRQSNIQNTHKAQIHVCTVPDQQKKKNRILNPVTY